MPRRPHGHPEGGGEDPEAGPSRPHGTHAGGHAGSVRQEEDAVAEVSRAGRAGSDKGGHSQQNNAITRMTGEQGGTPDGRPTRIKPDDDAATSRSIEMENSGAAVLADEGWHVKQNPTPDEVAQARQESGDTGDPQRNPDYLVEGRVFDCYSPTSPTKPARGIWAEVEEKVVEKQQTQRVVVNLEDWRGDVSGLRRQFGDWPIPGLKEVKVITPEGDIIEIELPGNRD
jgi:hypothetical protein